MSYHYTIIFPKRLILCICISSDFYGFSVTIAHQFLSVDLQALSGCPLLQDLLTCGLTSVFLHSCIAGSLMLVMKLQTYSTVCHLYTNDIPHEIEQNCYEKVKAQSINQKR